MRPSLLARHGALAAVIVVLLLTTAVRLRVANVPIERDEGEYAYAGQLILQGVPPYALAYNMKFPGPYYAYALILGIFGQTPWAIHLGLALVNIATAVILFALARRIFGKGQEPAAAVAASIFAVLSLDRFVLGVFTHATHFVVLYALAGLLALAQALESGRRRALLVAGVMLGVAVLMKQHAAAYVALGAAVLVWKDRQDAKPLAQTLGRGALLFGGVLLPVVLTCLVFAAQGVLGTFWFWTFDYARAYASEVPLAMAWPVFRVTFAWITQATTWIWLLAAAGLASLWIVRWPAATRLWLTGFVVAGFAAISPGFFFRSHYFVLLLPATALGAGAAVASAERLLSLSMPRMVARVAAIALAVAAAGAYAAGEWHYLTAMGDRELSRSMYSVNPFLEAPDVGRYLADHTQPEDRVAVLGSEPEILFYARRRSVTGYIYTYPLFESQPFAPRMIAEWQSEIESARPTYLVYASIAPSWTNGPVGDRSLMQWAGAYVRACYDVVGVADIAMTGTTTVWDAEAAAYQPRGDNVVYTMKRKSAAPCSASR